MPSHFWTFVEIRLSGVMSHHRILTLTLNQLPQMLWLWFITHMLHVLKKKTCMEFWATTSWIKSEMCVSSEAPVGWGCELQRPGCWRHTQPQACRGPQFNKHSGGRRCSAWQQNKFHLCTRHSQKEACCQGPGWTVAFFGSVGALARCTG